jgi:transcriptional regulator with XRE-family HTH domain
MKTLPAFGEFFKARRQALGLTLREFCLKHKFDPGNLSRMERGQLAPPQHREVLERYTKALDLTSGSDDWYTFLDLAAAAKGRLPDELLEDEEVVAKLPLVFKTLRSKPLTERRLSELVKAIRGK